MQHPAQPKNIKWNFVSLVFLCVLYFIPTAQTFGVGTTGEVIVIRGVACGGPGTTLIDDENGKPKCVCDAGWGKLASYSDGEPMCGRTSTKTPPIPVTPQPPVPPRPTPKKPSVLECNLRELGCMVKAVKGVDDCIARLSAYNGFMLGKKDPTPCFGQTVPELLDGISYYGFGNCTESLLNDPSSKIGEYCAYKFRERGMDRCMDGVKSTTVQTGVNAGVSLDLGFSDVSGIGITLGGSRTFSETSRPGIGIKEACMADGLAAFNACNEVSDKCKNIANGVAPMIVAAPPSTAENIISRIDKKLLGFSVGGGGNVRDRFRLRLADSWPFRDLKRGALEQNKLYLARLKFLEKWSNFLKRESINTAAKDAAHSAFASAQSKFSVSMDYYLKTIKAVWTVDVDTGEAGSDDLREILISYREKGGLNSVSVVAEKALRSELQGIIGVPRANKFFSEVWPGMVNFGYSRPMSNNAMVIAPTPRTGGTQTSPPRTGGTQRR